MINPVVANLHIIWLGVRLRRRKLHWTNLRPGEVTISATLGLTCFPNMSFRLIRNQHNYSMPHASICVVVCLQEHKPFIYWNYGHSTSVGSSCKSGEIEGGYLDEERPWRQSRRGEAVLFWSISRVPKDQSFHWGSKAHSGSGIHCEYLWPWKQGLMSTEHLQNEKCNDKS